MTFNFRIKISLFMCAYIYIYIYGLRNLAHYYCIDISHLKIADGHRFLVLFLCFINRPVLIAFPPLFLQTHQIRCNSEVTVKAFVCAWRSWLWSSFGLCNSSDTHPQVLLFSNQPFDSPGMKTYDCSIRPILELHSLLTFKEISFQGVEAIPATENKDHDSNVYIWIKPLFLQYFCINEVVCSSLKQKQRKF